MCERENKRQDASVCVLVAIVTVKGSLNRMESALYFSK